MNFFYVMIGGAIGAALRYGIYILSQSYSWLLPFPLFWVNCIGCFLIGFLSVTYVDLQNISALFVVTGVLGGFTSFFFFCPGVLSLIYEVTIFICSLLLAFTKRWVCYGMFFWCFFREKIKFFLKL